VAGALIALYAKKLIGTRTELGTSQEPEQGRRGSCAAPFRPPPTNLAYAIPNLKTGAVIKIFDPHVFSHFTHTGVFAGNREAFRLSTCVSKSWGH